MLRPSKLFSGIVIIIFGSILLLVSAELANAESYPIEQDVYGKYLTDRIIVVCEYDSPQLLTAKSQCGAVSSGYESIDMLCQRYNITEIEPFYPGKIKNQELAREVSRMYIFHFDEPTDLQAMISDFTANSHIEFAERYSIPDLCFTPNDPDISQQWYLATTHAYQAWDVVRGDTTRHAIIGIVDTGVYWDHPDLAANIWINDAEDVNHNGLFDDADNDGIDADSNGYPDDVIAWDFGGPDNNPAEITPWHGTAVAGCASEVTDNGAKGASIGYSARLMCVKATNYQNDLVYCYQGIVYAADQGVDIINCSWGSPGYSRANQNIINHVYSMGVSVMASSGGTSNIIYPGGYDHVVSVGSTDENDHIPGFSDGDSLIDIYAPGTNILTTWDHNTMIRMDGTSMSSPIVCGLAALIMSWHPEFTPAQVEETVESSADSIGYLNPSHPNAIRINCNNWLLTGINDTPKSAPDRFTLLENYPNPFNAQTEIRFVLPAACDVEITLFDITGRIAVKSVCGMLPAGYNAVRIDGRGMASGIYLYRIQAGGYSATKKCLLLK